MGEVINTHVDLGNIPWKDKKGLELMSTFLK
jgi:hypothetical protein